MKQNVWAACPHDFKKALANLTLFSKEKDSWDLAESVVDMQECLDWYIKEANEYIQANYQ